MPHPGSWQGENLIFIILLKKKKKLNSSVNAICRTPPEGREMEWSPLGAFQASRPCEALWAAKIEQLSGPPCPVPIPGEARPGRGASGEDPSEGISVAPTLCSDPGCPWVTLVLGQGAVPKSPVPLGSREEAGGENPVLRGRGARPETAGMGAGEAGTGSARAAQLRPEPAVAGNSAQRWVSLSPLGPAGLGWGCRAPG